MSLSSDIRIETKLLDDARVLAAGKFAVVFRLRTSHDHLARGEDKCSGLRFANAHDDSSETLRVVLCVTCLEHMSSCWRMISAHISDLHGVQLS